MHGFRHQMTVDEQRFGQEEYILKKTADSNSGTDMKTELITVTETCLHARDI